MHQSPSKISRTLIATAALALGGLSLNAQAAPVSFFGVDISSGSGNLLLQPNSDTARNSFFSNLTGVGTETFESIGLGNTAPLTLNFGSAGTATLTGAGRLAGPPPTGSNQYGIGNSKYWSTVTGNFTINFSSAVAAFGFNGIDIESELVLRLTKTGGGTVDIDPGFTRNRTGSIFYYGFYDTTDTYSSIEFRNPQPGGDIYAFDNMSIGSRQQVTSPIPEPESYALMLAGLGLVGATARRRKAKNTA